MKKFTKLLILLLSLVTIFTAFTVVALADGEAALSTPRIKNIGNGGPDWDGKLDGTLFGSGTASGRYGYIYAEASDTQNLYGVFMMSPKKSNVSTSDNSYYGEDLALDTSTEKRTIGESSVTVYTYNPIDYPYFVYSFDTMTPTGNFGVVDADNPYAPMNDLQFRTGIGGSQKGNYSLIIDTPTIFNKLDSTPYKWQHVTVIAKYRADNVGANGKTVAAEYDIELYVDGVRVPGEVVEGVEQKLLTNVAPDSAKSLAIGIIPEQLGYTFLRLSTYSGSNPISGYVATDPSTWPDTDPSEWSKAKVALDNPQISYYQDDWSFAQIAKSEYEANKASVPTGGKAVAAVQTPAGVVTYYGNAADAVNAAADGDTVIILADIEEPLAIDKAITIDLGMRYDQQILNVPVVDENGDPVYKDDGVTQQTQTVTTTYLLGAHDVTFFSRTGYVAAPVAEAEGVVVNTDDSGNAYVGIYKFEKSENAYIVNWDPECEGECDCHEMTKHLLTEATTVTVGNAPAYIWEIPAFEITKNGFGVVFVGWSTEKGGEAIDLSTFTAEAGETVNLYPVYEYVQYAFELITSADKSTFYLEEDFDEQLINAAANLADATIKLHTDVYTEVPTVKLYKSLTIDLNGHNLKRCFVYGNVYEATKNGEDFVYGTDNATTVASGGDVFFQTYAVNIVLTITSSNGGGTFYNMKMNANTWTYENKVVKRDSSGVTTARVTNSSESVSKKSPFTVKLNGGITIYAGQLMWQGHADGSYNVYIDNVKYYKFDSDTFIWLRTNQKIDIEITDSLLFAPSNSGSMMYLGTSGKTYNSIYDSNVIITNCDFIKPETSWGMAVSISRPTGNTKVVFDNCRLYDAGAYSNTAAHVDVTGINGTLGVYSEESSKQSVPVNAADGWENREASVTYIYYVPSSSTSLPVNSDSIIDVPTFDIPATNKLALTFNRVITKPVEVTWMNGDEVHSTETLYPVADSFAGPKIIIELPNDLYRDMRLQFVDKNGTLSTETAIDWAVDSYTFYSAETVNGVTKYVAAPKATMFSLSYMGHLAYNLYTPIVDGVTINQLGAHYTPSKVVIDGVDYWCANAGWITPQTAIDTSEVQIIYTIDGVKYTANFKISALIYAELLSEFGGVTDIELDAIYKLIAYVEEVYSYTGTMTDEKQAAFDTFFNTYNEGNRPAYVTEYPQDELVEVDAGFKALGIVDSFGIMIAPDNRIAIVATVNKASADLGYKITFKAGGGSQTAYTSTKDDGSVVYYTNNTHLANVLMTQSMVISIVDSAGNTVASTNYNMATYANAIKEMEGADVVASLYTFGKAVIKVRHYLSTL